MTTTDLARTDDAPSTALANPEDATAALTHYLGTGDLSRLPGEQKAALYLDTCASLQINPRTRPFDWIEFYDPETKGKKLTLYPNKTCADQLAFQHRIRVRTVEEKIVGTLFKVIVEGTMPNGRTETNVAYLDLTDRDGNQLRGQKLGNAFMKGHTKAKRRLIFGMLGMMAPPDTDELQQARVVTVDGRGNVLEHPNEMQRMLAERPGMADIIGEPTFETVADVSQSPLAGTSGQQVSPDELEQPVQPAGPPATFRNTDEQIEAWRRTWFATVKGLSLDTDEARAAFIAQWSADEWPKAKRTDSLATFLARATPAEAEELLNHVRALMADERRELLAWADEDSGGSQSAARPDVDQRVHDAVQITGGPASADADDEPVAF